MRKLKFLPTQKGQLTARDRAIEQAARSGLSWTEQAIAGLAALPPGTCGWVEVHLPAHLHAKPIARTVQAPSLVASVPASA